MLPVGRGSAVLDDRRHPRRCSPSSSSSRCRSGCTALATSSLLGAAAADILIKGRLRRRPPRVRPGLKASPTSALLSSRAQPAGHARAPLCRHQPRRGRSAIVALATRLWWLLWAPPGRGYGFARGARVLVERNCPRPSPILCWFARRGFQNVGDVDVTRRLGPELERAGVSGNGHAREIVR